MSTERDELAKVIYTSHRGNTQVDLLDNRRLQGSQLAWARFAADTLIAAGYRKTDHTEYALDHNRSDLQFTDDDGELWTDEDDFREYAEEYGDSMQMMRRRVTEWEPLP